MVNKLSAAIMGLYTKNAINVLVVVAAAPIAIQRSIRAVVFIWTLD
jgi:hypothetical protein